LVPSLTTTCPPVGSINQRIGDLDVSGDLCVVVNEAAVVLGHLRGKALQGKPSRPVEQVIDRAPSTPAQFLPPLSEHRRFTRNYE
jgi:hypothetical protein